MKDQVHVYRYKENEYYQLVAHGKMQLPGSNDWVPSVTYQACTTGDVYTSTFERFYDEFELACLVKV